VLEGASSVAGSAAAGVELIGVEPFRPRTRLVPPPAGFGPRARIINLTGALHERTAARILTLEPEAAADELLSTLAGWGELPAGLLDKTHVDAQPDGDPTEAL
jgi:electron transfer flavoprotein beta subunit